MSIKNRLRPLPCRWSYVLRATGIRGFLQCIHSLQNQPRMSFVETLPCPAFEGANCDGTIAVADFFAEERGRNNPFRKPETHSGRILASMRRIEGENKIAVRQAMAEVLPEEGGPPQHMEAATAAGRVISSTKDNFEGSLGKSSHLRSSHGLPLPEPEFDCPICFVPHAIDGACTLPCGHRFCFESLKYHFTLIVKERRLDKLVCPLAPSCIVSLRDEMPFFQSCLDVGVYQKLLEFLARERGEVVECPVPGCEERVWCDLVVGDGGQDLRCANGHGFCGKCSYGPHVGMSCASAERAKLEKGLAFLEEGMQMERRRAAAQEQAERETSLEVARGMGFRPCPSLCKFGGGHKRDEECDHVICRCGLE